MNKKLETRFSLSLYPQHKEILDKLAAKYKVGSISKVIEVLCFTGKIHDKM